MCLVFSQAEVGGVPSDDDIGMLHVFQCCRKSAKLPRNRQYPHVLGNARDRHRHGSCLPSRAATTISWLVAGEYHQEFPLTDIFEIFRKWQQSVAQCQEERRKDRIRDGHHGRSLRWKIGPQHSGQH